MIARVLLLSFALVASVVAEPDDSLVRQLGSPVPQERSVAEQQLRERGTAAFPSPPMFALICNTKKSNWHPFRFGLIL